jgi:hypothetical protein
MTRHHLDAAFAERFAAEWIASWNARDLDRVLAHYAEDFEMSSPMIVRIAGEPSGTLRGKSAVGAYWRKALDMLPDLRFEPACVLTGTRSIVIHYKGAGGRLVAEVLEFDADGSVIRASAHYAA